MEETITNILKLANSDSDYSILNWWSGYFSARYAPRWFIRVTSDSTRLEFVNQLVSLLADIK